MGWLVRSLKEGRLAMILVVGGLNGFIGSNTTEALVDLGRGLRGHTAREH